MTYAKDAWYVAGFEMDLKDDAPFAATVLGEPIVIYRGRSGRAVALEDRCVHRLAPLSMGKCEGDNIRCMYHGLLFDANGKCVEIPGQDMIPPKAKVRSYPILIKESYLWVWMGNPAKADETLVPPALGYGHPEWLVDHGFLDYEAEASLVCDNVLDFSHIPFLHYKSLQLGPNYAEVRPRVTAVERGVRIDRWTLDTVGPAMGTEFEAQTGSTGSINSGVGQNLMDHYLSYDLIIPGLFLLWSGLFPTGTAKALDFEKPDYAKAISVNYQSHAITPLTKGRSRYFYLCAVQKGEGDRAYLEMVRAVQELAFLEDKWIIDAQQKMFDTTPDAQVMPIAADYAVTLYNRAVERLAMEAGEAGRAAYAASA